MTLHVCDDCTSKFPPDTTVCPHCGCTDSHEEGAMPKITRHGGPSYADDIPDGDDNAASDAGLREHPGTGVEMEEVEMTANEDGSFSGEITNDGSGVALPPADEEQEAKGDDGDNDVEPDAQPADATLPRPATNATKGEWLAYARQVIEEDIDDADYTKAELIDLVGKG